MKAIKNYKEQVKPLNNKTMKTYIPQLLEREPEQLKEIKWQLFLDVALNFSYNNVDAQYLVTNQKLYNWFNTQVDHLESEFIKSVANGKIVTKSKFELFSLYKFRIEKVKKLFPRLILNNIRKSKVNVKFDYLKYYLN